MFIGTFAEKRELPGKWCRYAIVGGMIMADYFISVKLDGDIILKEVAIIGAGTIFMCLYFRQRCIKTAIFVISYQGICFIMDYISILMLSKCFPAITVERLSEPLLINALLGILSQMLQVCFIMVLRRYVVKKSWDFPKYLLMSCVANNLIFIDKVIGCKLARWVTSPQRFPARTGNAAPRRTRYASAVSLPAKEVSCIFIWEPCPTVSPLAGYRPQVSHADFLPLAHPPDTHGSLIPASRRICLYGWHGRFLHRRNQIRRSPPLRHESPRSPRAPRPHHLLQ